MGAGRPHCRTCLRVRRRGRHHTADSRGGLGATPLCTPGHEVRGVLLATPDYRSGDGVTLGPLKDWASWGQPRALRKGLPRGWGRDVLVGMAACRLGGGAAPRPPGNWKTRVEMGITRPPRPPGRGRPGRDGDDPFPRWRRESPRWIWQTTTLSRPMSEDSGVVPRITRNYAPADAHTQTRRHTWGHTHSSFMGGG